MPSASSLLVLLSCLMAHAAWADGLRMLAQRSPLAGAQFHSLAGRLVEGAGGRCADAGARTGQPARPACAVRVLWRGRMLGYLPRAANFEAAAEMDAGQRLSARIGRITDDADPWKRLRVDVFVELAPVR
jgi:hypothetical protein